MTIISTFRNMSAKRKIVSGLLLSSALLLLVALYVWGSYFVTGRVPLPLVNQVLAIDQPLYSTSFYGLSEPMGVAVSPDGERIYVTEHGDKRLIRVFDKKGNALLELAPPDTTELNRWPTYVAVSRDGSIYATDIHRKVIDVYSSNGNYLGVLTPQLGPDEKFTPLALAIANDDELYVTDVTGEGGQHRVLILSMDGVVLGKIEAKVSFPNGLAIDGEGRIYVADSNVGRVLVFDRSGQLIGGVSETKSEPLGLPRGLAFDKGGRLLMVDTFDHSLAVFQAGLPLKFNFKLGAKGKGNGQFQFPNGVAVDRNGRIYIADKLSNRVQVWF